MRKREKVEYRPIHRGLDEVIDVSKKKRNLLRKMFDRQVDTLLAKRYPLAAHMSERRFVEEYIDPLRKSVEEVDEVVVGDGLVPLLIVFRFRAIRPHELMSRVAFGGKEGETFLAGEAFFNVVKIPSASAYLALGVENGSALSDMGREGGEAELKRRGAYGLTVEEGAALVTHYPEILGSRCLDLHGSFYNSCIPSIGICEEGSAKGRPQLNIWEVNGEPRKAGIPSCRERI